MLASVLGARDTAANKPGLVSAWTCSQPRGAGKHNQCTRHSGWASVGVEGPKQRAPNTVCVLECRAGEERRLSVERVEA